MELSFEWMKCFDPDSESEYIRSLATLIGVRGARKLVEIAHIYETHDWFQLFVAKNKKTYSRYCWLCIMSLSMDHMKHGSVCLLSIGD